MPFNGFDFKLKNNPDTFLTAFVRFTQQFYTSQNNLFKDISACCTTLNLTTFKFTELIMGR